MPKDRRSRSVSFDRSSPFTSGSFKRRRCSPHPFSSSSASGVSSPSINTPHSVALASKDLEKWDEVRCPVCMEHPHNAVLLVCTSHDKGCRPFMCDTSYRHSNCLDQYRKSFDGVAEAEIEVESKVELSCPLCRGVVSGWKVIEPARKYMNTKARSCSTESCRFVGVYRELRRHARMVHPLVRPSAANPERQRDWRRIERQRDIGDLFSSMQSALVGGEDGLENQEILLRGDQQDHPGAKERGGGSLGDLISEAEANVSPLRSIEEVGDASYLNEVDVWSSDGHYEFVSGISGRRLGRNRRSLRVIDDDEDDDVE
ncbi:hypothetical protein HPP92_008860 [Vanilla planifolia]|uniref:Uncharacterized protein n=1 Tax=Vanilla planifolia TaxID=51239 RepID=A0A835V6E5_VANPL|nr:hypothetical protein HPP92_008860 [Vanilla planifolia]